MHRPATPLSGVRIGKRFEPRSTARSRMPCSPGRASLASEMLSNSVIEDVIAVSVDE
ncbi:MAG: hypothetical protein R2717_08435 [Schumannella sp.]